jgi:hypothetical protein
MAAPTWRLNGQRKRQPEHPYLAFLPTTDTMNGVQRGQSRLS